MHAGDDPPAQRPLAADGGGDGQGGGRLGGAAGRDHLKVRGFDWLADCVCAHLVIFTSVCVAVHGSITLPLLTSIEPTPPITSQHALAQVRRALLPERDLP